jgi:hypothetical protein
MVDCQVPDLFQDFSDAVGVSVEGPLRSVEVPGVEGALIPHAWWGKISKGILTANRRKGGGLPFLP